MTDTKTEIIKIKTSEILKIGLITDIHWGARNNSVQHNNDCENFIKWFKNLVIIEKCSHIFFLGDWFENRNAVNILTLNMSFSSLKSLNELNIPIFIIIGNHDLYTRHHRKVHSVLSFGEFSNVTIIEHPTLLNDNYFLCPFLFKEEYSEYGPIINKYKFVFGHFEFRNFILNGNYINVTGLNNSLLSKPKFIFSGHYHKRQTRDNIIYIGNTFPTNFGDLDDDRGCCFFNTSTEEICFENWENCPTFIKTKLSDVVEGNWNPKPQARVSCLLDIEITYSEAQILKDTFVQEFDLREFVIEENLEEKKNAVAGEEETLESLDMTSLEETVRTLLETGIQKTTTINASILIDIWNEL